MNELNLQFGSGCATDKFAVVPNRNRIYKYGWLSLRAWYHSKSWFGFKQE